MTVRRQRRKASEPVNALAPWFGCKRTLSAFIVPELGNPRAYWEPFCGSAAVLLSKAESKYETVNDLHGELVNLARVLKLERTALRLYSRLARTLPAQELFAEALDMVRKREKKLAPAPERPDVKRAAEFFIASWTGLNGVAGTQSCNTNFCRRFKSDGGSPSSRFLRAVETIPWWHNRLRNVMILNDDGFELLEKIEDGDRTTVFVDPPYFVKSARYRHDFKAEDHNRLAELLNRFKQTRVVLTYYADPRLAELYPPARWRTVKVEVMRSLSVANSGGTRRAATEMILVNDQSRSGTLF